MRIRANGPLALRVDLETKYLTMNYAVSPLVGIAFLVVVLSPLGCGGSTKVQVAKVNGIVTLNGDPVPGVSVCFLQEKCPLIGAGKTNEQGKYVLSSYGNDDGAPVGPCNVTLTLVPNDWTTVEAEVPFVDNSHIKDPDERMKANMAAKTARLDKIAALAAARKKNKKEFKIPIKYASTETSGLSVTVIAGKQNEFEFELSD
jgi:hypothetical protein